MLVQRCDSRVSALCSGAILAAKKGRLNKDVEIDRTSLIIMQGQHDNHALWQAVRATF